MSSERVVATLLVAVAVVGAFAGPVAAGHDEVPENGTDGEANGHVETAGNSTLLVYQAAGAGGEGGWLLVDCEGDTNVTHECDKSGSLDAGPVSVAYEGYNHANPPGLVGGGGDEVTVTVQNRSATGAFDCDLQTSTLPAPCTANGSTSETGPLRSP